MKHGGRRCYWLLAVTLGLGLALLAGAVGAEGVLTSYTIDARGFTVPIPEPYAPDLEINGLSTEAGAFKDPSQIFVDQHGNLFVADTGRDRVLKFDQRGRLAKIFGQTLGLRGPKGVFVTASDDVYIADTGNQRIVETNPDGRLLREIHKPQSPGLTLERNFQPAQIIVDRRNYLYVLENGSTSGIMVLDADGNFRGYFGATRLQFDLREFLVSLFATREQKEQLLTPEPVPHSSMFLGPDDFIYTTVASVPRDQIQKLNPVGINVFRPSLTQHQVFGERSVVNNRVMDPSFTSVAVDQFGVVTAIDRTSGKIYQYDQARHLLSVFGGHGHGPAEFDFPSSISVDPQGDLYILDGSRNVVYRLRPTRFTQLIHQASQLYNDGRYTEAANLWRQVLKYDAQYEPAYVGIADAESVQGHYQRAMAEYQFAYDRAGYSDAFGEYRYEWLRANFGSLMIGLLVVLLLITMAGGPVRRLKRRLTSLKWLDGERWPTLRSVYGILREPQDTLWELRERGSLWAVLVLVLLACIVRIASLWLLAFHMLESPQFTSIFSYLSPYNLVTYYYLREVDPDQISVLVEMVRIIAPFLAWVVVSYGVGVILEGEASFTATLRSSAYCLVPYILFTIPVALLTHVLTREERGLVDFLLSVIYLWCGGLFWLQVRVVHDFEYGKSLRTIVVSAFGMLALFGFGIMIYLITSQIYRFVAEVIYELTTG